MIGYILLFIVVIYTTNLSRKYEKASLSLIFFFLTCFVGFRYHVGRDYENYVDIYNSVDFQYLEPAFAFLVEWLNSFHCSVTYLFFIMAFLTYGFLFGGIYCIKEANLPLSIFMLSIFTFSSICNVTRQALASAVFLFAFQFIIKRKLSFYILCILLASTFHVSALILLPLYFLLDKQLSDKYIISIYLMSFVFVFLDLGTIAGPFMSLMENWQRYENYVEKRGDEDGYLSPGVVLEMANYAIMLYYSIKANVHRNHTVLFNLLLLGAILMNVRIGAPLLIRLQMYFSFFINIILPLVVIEQKSKQTRHLLALYFGITQLALWGYYIFFIPTSDMYPYKDVFGIL